MMFIQLILFMSHALASELVLESEASIHYLKSGKKEIVQKGQKYSFLGAEPALIEKEGKIPVLLLPLNNNSDIQLNLTNANEISKSVDAEILRQNLNSAMNELIINIFQIQKYISQGKFDEAKKILSKSATKYPDTDALDFLNVSIMLLENKKSEALSFLERALKKNPDYPEGQALLKQLKAEQGVRK